MQPVTDALDGFLAQAREGLTQQLWRVGAVPDLADVVARARALDPAGIPESAVREAAQLAPVVQLQGARSTATGASDPALAGFLADVRETLEATANHRKLAGIPGAPLPHPARRVRVRVLGVALGLSLAAALVVGVGITRGIELTRTHDAARGSQAAAVPIDPRAGPQPTTEPNRPTRNPGAHEGSLEPSAAEAVPVAPPELERAPSLDPAQPRLHRARAGSGAVHPAIALDGPVLDSLDALETEAKALWRAGDLMAAEERLRRIAALAGTSRRAELAFGDLMSIAHRIHGAGRQSDLWREYLRRFPQGLYSDDARAGLCRRAQDPHRAACWAQYLADFSEGAHRAQATEEISALGELEDRD